VAHPHPVRAIQPFPPLAAHRVVQVAPAPSLHQARLCLIRVRVLVSHHLAVVQAHLALLRSRPVHLAFHHLRAAVLHLVPLHSLHARPVAVHRPVTQHFPQAHRVLVAQVLVVLHSLLAVVRVVSASHHQALHPVTQHFLLHHVLALALHLRARAFKNYKASIGIQLVRTVDILFLLWDLALISQIE